MSYSYRLAGDVRAEWQRLDVDLQELALDAIEAALELPPEEGEELFVLLRRVTEAGEERLRLRLLWSPSSRMASVVGCHLTRLPPPFLAL